MIVMVAPLVQLSLHHRRENLTDEGRPNGKFVTEIGQMKKEKLQTTTEDNEQLLSEMNDEDDIGYEAILRGSLSQWLQRPLGGASSDGGAPRANELPISTGLTHLLLLGDWGTMPL